MQDDLIFDKKEAQMSMWTKWKKRRDLTEGLGEGGSPVDSFKFNTGGDGHAEDYEHIQHELFSIVMSKYPDETMQFLDGIAQRGDEEVLNLLRKLQQEPSMGDEDGNTPRNPPEVVPPASDTGHSDFGGGEE